MIGLFLSFVVGGEGILESQIEAEVECDGIDGQRHHAMRTTAVFDGWFAEGDASSVIGIGPARCCVRRRMTELSSLSKIDHSKTRS